MAAATLSGDQRHLLSLLNPESLLDALLSTQGADRVMSRSGGGCGFAAPEGAPAWMTNYDTVHRQIVSPTAWHGPPQVAVSAAQIVRFGAGLPEPVREQMRAWTGATAPTPTGPAMPMPVPAPATTRPTPRPPPTAPPCARSPTAPPPWWPTSSLSETGNSRCSPESTTLPAVRPPGPRPHPRPALSWAPAPAFLAPIPGPPDQGGNPQKCCPKPTPGCRL